MSVCPEELKLVALDRDDIEVVSAHVQDALVWVGDIYWQPREHRFVMAVNRFDWMKTIEPAADYRRCRTALRFERVLACKCRGINPSNREARLNLLAVEFAGAVTLTFSGGGSIRLDVECLEAELADLGEVTTAEICPDHFASGSVATA